MKNPASSWREGPLGDILRLEYGKPLDDSDRDPDGLYPAYGANGQKARTNKYYSDKPSIIVGRKGSAGEINLTEEKFWPLDVTYFVTFDEKQNDLRFLFYLLATLGLPSLARGVKPGLNRNEVYSLVVKTPLLPEQQRIVTILDDAFEGIATAKANAEKNLQNARAVFESRLDEVFSNAGSDWVESTVESDIRFIDYRGRTPEKTDSGLRLITAKNVRMGFLQDEPMEYVAPDSYDGWMTRGIPKKGDVLFTTEAPLGNVAQLDTDEKVVFAQRIITLQPNRSKLDPTFLKYMLLSPPVQRRILEKGTGATALGIKASLLKKIPIQFPRATTVQAAIARRFDELEDLVERLEALYSQKNDALDELKKSLLHQAFSGALSGARC